MKDFLSLKTHTLLPVYERRIRLAKECIEYAFTLCKRPYVSFSAGKDSAVMLHLVLAVKPDATVKILTGGESRLLHGNLDEVITWWKNNFKSMNFQEIHVDHVFAPGWETVTFEEQYKTFKNEWVKYLHSDDHDGVFIGLRADESSYRKAWLKTRIDGYPIRQYQDGKLKGVYRIAPLADWKEIDIAAYVVKNNIPLLTGYENGFDARTKTRIGGKAMISFGQLAELRARDPKSYQEIIDRFPELARYT